MASTALRRKIGISMRRRHIVILLASATLAVVVYLSFWPVAIDPVAWTAPPAIPLASDLPITSTDQRPPAFDLGGRRGPETLARTRDGDIVTGTECGAVLRIARDDGRVSVVAKTGGRPLGIAEDQDGTLIVADAMRGLLAIAPDGTITELITAATAVPDGIAIGFANSVAIGHDRRIYFTDSSSRFPPARWGVDEAAFLDLLEHGRCGRLLRMDRRGGAVEVLAEGLGFANGVALSDDGRTAFVCETALYRVLRIPLDGDGSSAIETLVEHLPGFPDNITRGSDGRLWIGLVAERSAVLDRLARRPFLRRSVARIPRRLRPAPKDVGTAIAIDERGQIVHAVRDQTRGSSRITGVLEIDGILHVGTLDGMSIPRRPLPFGPGSASSGSSDDLVP